jgi:hypothetical protein
LNLQEPEKRNAAGRLIALLLSIPEGGVESSFPKLLGIDGRNHLGKKATLEVRMALDRSYREFCSELESSELSDEQKELFRGGLSEFEASVYPQGNGAYRKPTPAELSMLRLCAQMLPQENQVLLDDLAQLSNAISDLQQLIHQSEISRPLKLALLELTRLATDALNRYRIVGAKGLRKAFKTMLVESKELFEEAKADEKDKNSPVWRSLGQLMVMLDKVSSSAMKCEKYLTYVPKLLEYLPL